MKALVTRPREDSGPLVEALRERGIDAVVEPLLAIRLRDNPALDLEGVQALLFTSANGARAAAAATASRDLPVFAVGDATAHEARSLGWTGVESAAGNVEDLARLVAQRLKPEDGALLHVAGSAVAGDLVRLLGGFSVRRTVLYDAEPADAFSPETAALLREGGLDLAFFFSPRTAARFAALARALPARLDGAAALCLSPPVAEAVRGLGWRDVRSAEAPAQASLVAVLDAILAGRHDAPSSSKGDAMSEPAAPPSGEASATQPAVPESPRAASPHPETRPAARHRSDAFWPVVALVLVLAAIAAAPFVAPALPWGPQRAAGISPGEVAALADRVAALESRPASAVPPELGERLAELEQRPQPTVPADLAERVKRLEERPAPAAVPADLAQRVQQLEQRPEADPAAAAAARTEAQRLAGEVQALQQRLDAIEARERRDEAVDRTDQALLLAVTQLRQTAAAGRPFAAELGAATALAKDRPDIAASLATLQPLAAKGVPTAAALARQFETTAGAIARAGAAPPSEDWRDQILAKLRGLVTIRRVGKDGGATGADAAVASAEQALAADDLAGAVTVLGTLQDAEAAAAKPWLEAARRRLQLDAALAGADRALMARLAPDGKS